MPDKLKILWLPTTCSGVVWHRMFQFFRYMRDRDDVSVAMDKFDPKRTTPYEWQFKQNSSTLLLNQMEKLISQADVLIVGFVITDYGVAVLQGIRTAFPKLPLITEIDDYCDEINSYHPAATVFRPWSEPTNAIKEQITLSDHVVVSTPYLKKLYSEYNPKIKVIRNSIDFKIWDDLRTPKKHERIRIGWCGASSHGEDLKYIEKVVYRILDKYKDVEFYFAGGAPHFLVRKHPRIICNNKWADVYQYPQALKDKAFDIGIAPLLDNNFNRAKSNLRWLEYSALSIPSVCSSVEDFKITIKDGKTGFLVTELDEWFERLSLLIENEEIRLKMGKSANDEIRKNFNLEKISIEYENFLTETYDEFKRNKGQGKADDGRTDSRNGNIRH